MLFGSTKSKDQIYVLSQNSVPLFWSLFFYDFSESVAVGFPANALRFVSEKYQRCGLEFTGNSFSFS